MKTIFLTGAAGFIGSHTLEYLFDKYPDYRFLVLDALTYAGDIKNISQRVQDSGRFEFWYGDVRNAKLVDNLVSQSDIIVHFAAETHVTRSIYDNMRFFETDVLGTQVLANAVSQNMDTVDRFIHISTSEVYGTAAGSFMDENHPLNPCSPYAAAKAGADRLVYSYIITYNLPAVIVRPFNMYGPKQHLEKAIPRFITSCILEEDITVHGDGQSKRDFTYVDDLARALDLIIQAPLEKVRGEVFNVGAGRDFTMEDIARRVREIMNPQKSQVIFIGDRPGQVFRHTANADKIKRILGWEPSMNFESGLSKTINWYIENKEWWLEKKWMRHVPIITVAGKRELH